MSSGSRPLKLSGSPFSFGSTSTTSALVHARPTRIRTAVVTEAAKRALMAAFEAIDLEAVEELDELAVDDAELFETFADRPATEARHVLTELELRMMHPASRHHALGVSRRPRGRRAPRTGSRRAARRVASRDGPARSSGEDDPEHDLGVIPLGEFRRAVAGWLGGER